MYPRQRQRFSSISPQSHVLSLRSLALRPQRYPRHTVVVREGIAPNPIAASVAGSIRNEHCRIPATIHHFPMLFPSVIIDLESFHQTINGHDRVRERASTGDSVDSHSVNRIRCLDGLRGGTFADRAPLFTLSAGSRKAVSFRAP